MTAAFCKGPIDAATAFTLTLVCRLKVAGHLEIKLCAHRSAHRSRDMKSTQMLTETIKHCRLKLFERNSSDEQRVL